MYNVVRRFVVLSAVAVLAAGSAACGSHNDSDTSPASILGPSATDAKGGGKGGGKPGGSTGGGSLSPVMYTDNNGDGRPNWNDTVTFNVSTSSTDTPTVTVVCSQNGVAVYGATGGFYPSYPWQWTRYMTLYSASWSGGAANCTATLAPVGGSPVLATLSFTAGA